MPPRYPAPAAPAATPRIVDNNAASTYSELDVIDPDDAKYEKVDAIIVTATFAFDDIEEKLAEKVDFPIISLEDVVYES